MPVFEKIIPPLLKYGIDDLEKYCQMTPGVPIKPMLAFPAKSMREIVSRFEGQWISCDYKYDGERVQIHKCPDGRIFVSSRNLENMSNKYPDIPDKINKIIELNSKNGDSTASTHPLSSFVLDCEAVAWDKCEKRILPFQVLSTRKRKVPFLNLSLFTVMV